MPGPPPKHPSQRRRTNPTVALTRLPAEGRKGKPPAWPLIPDVVMTARRDLAEAKVDQFQHERAELLEEGRPTGVIERKIDGALERLTILNRQLDAQQGLEAQLWADLWKLPQAVEWERQGWLRDAAQYVRFKVLAELGELDAAKEARMWSDRLGLNPVAMLRLRWEIARDELAEKRTERAAPTEAPGSGSARGRLRIADAS